MNLLDLAFKFDIKIDFDGDFDGGNYYIKMYYLSSTQSGVTYTDEKFTLKQTDIDHLYQGAKQLVTALEKHASKDY